MKKRLFKKLFIALCIIWIVAVISGKAQFGMPPTNIEGWSVATHSSGTWGAGSLTNKPVIGLTNTRNCDNLAPFGVNWTSAMTSIYHGPTNNWIASNLGQVYGIAIDKKNNIYTTSTSVYNHVGEPLQFGPAGPGGVYKIDYASGNITTVCSSSSYTTSAISSILTSKIPNGDGINSGPGLGNICYDKDNDRLYVTNMEDGTIYRINPTTNKIDAVYDPGATSPILAPSGTTNPTMAADGGTSGFAPLGERLWGIGYNPTDKRIYYSVWVEGYASNSPTTYNIIRSVSVNATGFVPASDQFEFKLTNMVGGILSMPNGSMPVADIEFSLDGKKMLVGECGVNQDYSSVAGANTGHSNRVFEYKGGAGSWLLNQQINVGIMSNGRQNAAGGVDYGVSYINPVNGACGQAQCDSIIWTTGNYLVSSPTFVVYGLQSTPASGNTPATVQSLGHFVDLNGMAGTADKTQIGDVDIFKGECKGVTSSPCDKINVTANSISQKQGECCWNFSISGTTSGIFDHVAATPITSGVFFSATSAPAGWGVNLISNVASWSPTSGPIMTDSTSGLRSCFVNASGSAVFSIQFAFYTTQGTVCYDTVRLDCAPVTIQNDSCCAPAIVRANCVSTSQNGSSYSITMSIQNFSVLSLPPSNQYAHQVMITTSQPGVTITPTMNNLNSPTGLAFGQIGNVTFTVTGATPNTELCFDITLLGDSVGMPCCPYLWCCHKKICFTLPECKDCCKEFTKRIIQPTTTTNSAGQVANIITVQAGAKPISKLTIQLVSSSIKVSCRPNIVGASESSAGWQTVGATIQSSLPNPITPGLPLYSQTSYEGVWGINPSGVNLMSAPVTLSSFNLLFPPPPCNGYKQTCWDTIMYCLKISFTDSMCVTCDTTICYTIRRSGRPWWSCLTFPPPHGSHGIPEILTFKMKDDKTGNLNIALPSEMQGDEIAVKQICAQTTFGSHLILFDGVNAKDFSSCSGKGMKSGETKDIPLVVDNFGKLNRIGLIVTMLYSAVGSQETLVKVDTVYSSSPVDQGGDKIDETGDKTVRTRTYSLTFTNLNKSKGVISDVELRMPKGVHLLAFGSAFGDTINLQANANFKNDTIRIENYFVVERCCAQDKNIASKRVGLAPNGVVKPIYITVSGAESGFDLSFTTTDSNGVVLSEGTLKLTNPLSTVKDNDDASAVTGAAMKLDLSPNPSTNSTTINLGLQNSEVISLALVDINGKEVLSVLKENLLQNGNHAFVLNTQDIPSGEYIVIARTTSGKGITKKLQVNK